MDGSLSREFLPALRAFEIAVGVILDDLIDVALDQMPRGGFAVAIQPGPAPVAVDGYRARFFLGHRRP